MSHLGIELDIYTTDAGQAHVKYKREYDDISSMCGHACHGWQISLVTYVSIAIGIYTTNAGGKHPRNTRVNKHMDTSAVLLFQGSFLSA